MTGSVLQRFGVPTLFVLIWSTGFVVAKYGLPFAPPLLFLSWRFGLTCLVLGAVIAFMRSPWPSRSQVGHLIVAGILIQAGYLSGVWAAIKLGMPAGLAALIVNLQPVLTALAASWVGEKVRPVQWLGLALGFAGVALVVMQKLNDMTAPGPSVALAVMALIAITIGTLYQKRYVPQFDLRTGTWVQYAAALAVVLPLSLALEDESVQWNLSFVAAMAWSVLALSIGAIFLMFMLIRRGAATQVSSLMYLVPPVTALLAWMMFDEPFGIVAILGMAITALGVALATRAPSKGSR
jgi:drug/metabolite transporter (DMT)-like permease